METDVRQLRHDLRGRANTVMLCVSALPYAADPREQLEYLDEIERAADRFIAVLDQLDTMSGHWQPT